MSLGVSVDITMAAAISADLVIAQVNANMPRVLGHSFLHVRDVGVIVEHDEEILTVARTPDVEAANIMARHVTRLIDDGATLQIGPGTSPEAVYILLSGKNDLGIHTQTMIDDIMRLHSMGVITNRRKGFNEGKIVASTAIGSKDLYEFLNDNPAIEFYPSDYVNSPDIIKRHHRMVAMNVGMAVDLTGQAAVDALPNNLFSGATGLLDFMRGAAEAESGKSILLLPATALQGKKKPYRADAGKYRRGGTPQRYPVRGHRVRRGESVRQKLAGKGAGVDQHRPSRFSGRTFFRSQKFGSGGAGTLFARLYPRRISIGSGGIQGNRRAAGDHPAGAAH